jgi:hypothetical protein
MRRTLARISGAPTERITADVRVGDLIDSLDLVELAGAIEEGIVTVRETEAQSDAHGTDDWPTRQTPAVTRSAVSQADPAAPFEPAYSALRIGGGELAGITPCPTHPLMPPLPGSPEPVRSPGG